MPTLLAERAVGRMPAGATRAVAAWVAHLRGHGAPVTDAKADEVMRLIAGADADDEAVEAVLGWLGIHDSAVTDVVLEQYREMVGSGR